MLRLFLVFLLSITVIADAMIPLVIQGMDDYPKYGKFMSKRNFKSSETKKQVSKPMIPEIVVKVTEKFGEILNSNKVASAIEKHFLNLHMTDFSFKALQMNISISNQKVETIRSPTIDIKRLGPTSLILTTTQGFAEFSASYRGVYRTIRDGDVTVTASGLELTLPIKLSPAQRPTAIESTFKGCSFALTGLQVEMTKPLFEQANDQFATLFKAYLEHAVCREAKIFVDEFFGQQLEKLLSHLPISLETGDTDYEFSPSFVGKPLVDGEGLSLAMNVARNPDSHTAVKVSSSDTENMVFVYISDTVFNSYLRATWPVDRALVISADNHPALAELLAGRSGVNIYFTSPPVVEFREYGAMLTATVNILSEKQILVRNLKIRSLIEKFEFTGPKNCEESEEDADCNEVSLKAQIVIEELSGASPEVLRYLRNHLVLLEKAMESNFHKLLPLKTDSYLPVKAIRGFLRRNTLVCGFDLSSTKNLFF